MRAIRLFIVSIVALFMVFFSYYAISRPELFLKTSSPAVIPLMSFANLYILFSRIVAYNATSNWWMFRMIALEIISLVILWFVLTLSFRKFENRY
ncbi:MAG: hypothetical protein PHD29_08885 [bacterium]|nr:hypothetical protein [bacterium]